MIEKIREKFMIPVPLFFLNKNEFVGSHGDFRYKITPDVKEKKLSVVIWHGKFCLEKSEIVSQAEFVLDENDESGYNDMCEWINEKYDSAF